VPLERDVWMRRTFPPRPTFRSRQLYWMDGVRRIESVRFL